MCRNGYIFNQTFTEWTLIQNATSTSEIMTVWRYRNSIIIIIIIIADLQNKVITVWQKKFYCRISNDN